MIVGAALAPVEKAIARKLERVELRVPDADGFRDIVRDRARDAIHRILAHGAAARGFAVAGALDARNSSVKSEAGRPFTFTLDIGVSAAQPGRA